MYKFEITAGDILICALLLMVLLIMFIEAPILMKLVKLCG